jgi:hypothetical protein
MKYSKPGRDPFIVLLNVIIPHPMTVNTPDKAMLSQRQFPCVNYQVNTI